MPDGALRVTTRRGAAIAIAALVAIVGLGFDPPTTRAASCDAASHDIHLANGRVTPGTGVAGTVFRFNVHYRSNAGCEPTKMAVTIDGVGVLAMTPNGDEFAAGVVYRRTVELPAGRLQYGFIATAGSGRGERTVVLSDVKPPTVVVEKPVPSPSPAPASASPAASPSTSPSVRPSPSPSPTQTAAGGGGGFGLPPGLGGGSGRSIFGSDGGSPLVLGLAAATLLSVVLLVVAFGVARKRQGVGAVLEPAVPGAPYAETRGLATPTLPPGVRPEEASIPRWRRPSLQEARGATDRGAAPVHAPMRFGTPAGGADRRIVAYRLVRMSSQPDELYGDEVGRLDRGDEVEVIREEAGFYMVIAPDDTVGWVHRTTLRTEIDEDGGPAA